MALAAQGRPLSRQVLAVLVMPTLILGLGRLVSGTNHLLFHVLIELFTIVVALTALAVASTARQFTHNHFTVFVAVALGWASTLDAMHLLSYQGLGLFPVADENLTMQFWLMARLLQAVALLCSPLFLHRSLEVNSLHVILAVPVAGLMLWIMSGTFPQAYVEGQGATAFKVHVEYLTLAMLLMAAVLLWQRRRLMAPRLFLLMQVTLFLMMLSGFEFADYVSDSELANEMGHVFKGYAYWFIYLALAQSTLREPFGMLSRTAGTYDTIPVPVCLVEAGGAILQANGAAGRHAGVAQEELVGRSVHDVFHGTLPAQADCPVCAAMARGAADFVAEARDGSGRVLECSVAPFAAPGRRQRYVHVAHDITERKRLSDDRDVLVRSLGERVKELRCLYAISELLAGAGQELSKLLPEVVRLLPSAFPHARYAHAALEGEAGFVGDRGGEEARYRLTREVLVGGRRFGSLHVFYDEGIQTVGAEGAPFLPEEDELLGTVAQRVGEAIERREAAEKVQRLTYLYEMLSATNRAAVRCNSKRQLLRQVFDALILHGTFPMLFIALTTDGEMPLRVVHSHGIDAARQPELEAILADVHGPMGDVFDDIRKGKVVWSQLPKSESHAAWLQYLGHAGVEERAILPLMCQGRTWGVITLFARGVGAFDHTELRLLNEMAADLEFVLNGLATLERSEAAEQRASALEIRFQQVFELSPAPMLIDAVSNQQVRLVNRAFQQWLGYDLHDIPTEDAWFERVYPDPALRQEIRTYWRKAVQKARTAGAAIHSPELHLRAKNGEERIARGTMTLVGDEAIVAWTDLTDMRRTEEALRASEAHFRNMIEQTVTSIYVRRGERFVYVNPSFCRLIGWSREELLAGRFWDFVAPDADNVRRVKEAWDQLEHGAQSARAETLFVCKSGEVRELGLNGTVIPWDDKPAVIVMAADITQRKQAERQIANYVKQLEASMHGTLQAVARMIDLRDPYTAGHQRRVGLIAGAVAREMGWTEDRCSALELTGLVHDIGKIAVPAEILSKPGRLSSVEMEMVRGHAQAGYEILKDVSFSFPVAEIIYQHHERLDGSGYPRGLKGEQILLEARILAVADVLESMAAHRPYRPALGVEAALADLEKGCGVIYDAAVVDALRRLIRDKGYTPPA